MTNKILPSKSDRTSQAIIDSAYALFTSQGYAATSMRQIADKAGLALGGIYNHFSSKEEIFQTVVQQRHPFFKLLPLLRETQGETLDEYIHGAARNLVAELGQHPEFLNLMLIELVEFKARHAPLLFDKIFPEIMEIAGRVAVFQDASRSIPAPLLMRAFLGMFFSFFLTELLLKNLLPVEMQAGALDVFVDIFLNGIKRQPAANSIPTEPQ
jgi:AcrR family transcriptional regulator